MQQLELERAAKVQKIQRQRSVRAAKEQAAEALEAARRTQQLLRGKEAGRLSSESQAAEVAQRGV